MAAPNNTVSTLTDVIKTVYDQSALFAFYQANQFRAVADVQRDTAAEPMRGNPVTFTKFAQVADHTSALSETADPTPDILTDSQTSITLVEYGGTIKATAKARLTSFVNLDPVEVHLATNNMESSIDTVARTALDAGTNIVRVNGRAADVNIVAGDTAAMKYAWQNRASLAANAVPPPAGSTFYLAFVHPEVVYDLQLETGENGWKYPQIYGASQARLFSGELGVFAGSRWIETPRAKKNADAGSGGTVDVYTTYFVGLQALGEAIGQEQHIRITGPFDDLGRFLSVGWYGLLGYGIVRQESLYQLRSSSSLATNV